MTETSELLRKLRDWRVDRDPMRRSFQVQEICTEAADLIEELGRRPSPHPIEGAVNDEAVEAAMDRSLSFVQPKLLDMMKNKGAVGVWCAGFRTAWQAASRVPDAVDRLIAGEVTLNDFLPHLHPSPDNTGEAVAWLYRYGAPEDNGAISWSDWITSTNNPDGQFGTWKVQSKPLYLHPPASDAVVEVKPKPNAMRDCLAYYYANEANPDRVQLPPYTWNMRQTNKALSEGWLKVGPGGWLVLSPAGHAAYVALSTRQPGDGE